MLVQTSITELVNPIEKVFPGKTSFSTSLIFNTKKLDMRVPNSITIDAIASIIPVLTIWSL
jgi:hypothetical protein